MHKNVLLILIANFQKRQLDRSREAILTSSGVFDMLLSSVVFFSFIIKLKLKVLGRPSSPQFWSVCKNMDNTISTLFCTN